MQANPDDQLTRHRKTGGLPIKAIVLGLAAVAILAALFWPRQQSAPPEIAGDSVPETTAEPAVLPPAEDIPRPEPPAETRPASPEATAPAEPEPEESLPPLDESDPLLRESLQSVGADEGLFATLQERENLVSSLGALVDGSSRGVIMRKLLPVPAPEAPFQVMQTDDGLTVIDPASYQRYNPYALAISGLNTGELAAQFHRLRPLFEAGWRQLGLDPEEFDNAVIRTLDRVLATLELEGPVALEQESVMYTYADPELEALTPLQKQLLRMGPANLRMIKAQARELRDALLGGQ